ncbi:prephenate dehydrogenase/arogenate dehydrogenase family protein [Malikia sp.]|uniref:prephenate dehydrogenase n=1 Tax=Malikia sp. TaxID=2070706 RepID=UPI002611B51A|nr:prephenate dehydrogenase/arogenate dehydrogenase family protein [Malikia sp.]MDD2729323.1 prephenate dehydrogenase/arogenate dehydrogenase family protein [Malikia sp.]
MFEQLGLIGCGLMGGSFALALKEAGLVRQVVGYSKSERTRERALALGAIDICAETLEQAVEGSDLVLLAVPVAATESSLAAIAPVLAPRALLMDVGSTKCDVVAAARRALGERLSRFVPAHPIAGKESAGIEHADVALYHERQLILTPLPETHPPLVALAAELWSLLGSQVLQMSPERHDAAYASVSHLPHLLAFAAMNAILGQPQADEWLALAGPGFRDFSRIAASDPSVWRDILLANREQVLAQSRHLRAALDTLEATMQAGDASALQALITQASQARAGWRLGGSTPSPSEADPA